MVDLFKQLADETRLRILVLLQCQGDLCVCELTAALVLSQPKISRHLSQLRRHGLVNTYRKRQWVYYRLQTTSPQFSEIMVLTARKQRDSAPYADDLQRLRSLEYLCGPEE